MEQGVFSHRSVPFFSFHKITVLVFEPLAANLSVDFQVFQMSQCFCQGKPQIVNVQVGPEQIPAQIIRGATPICFQLVLDGSQPFFMMVDQCVNPLPVMGKR